MTKQDNLIDKDTLGRMRAMLAGLPPRQKTQFNNREAVHEMADDIRRARDTLGYSLAEIAVMLADHGPEIKPATLRGYLRDMGKTKPKRKTTPKQGSGATSDSGHKEGIDPTLLGPTVADASNLHDG